MAAAEVLVSYTHIYSGCRTIVMHDQSIKKRKGGSKQMVKKSGSDFRARDASAFGSCCQIAQWTC